MNTPSNRFNHGGVNHGGVNRWLVGLAISLTLLLSVSLTLNVALASKIREANHRAGIPENLQPGTALPALVAKDLAGKPVKISVTGRPSLLYIFTPACSWCARNLENWKAVAAHAGGSHQVVNISLATSGLDEYVKKNHVDTPVYQNVSPSIIQAYKLAATPTTIVVGPDGRVLKSWAGAYSGAVKKEIEDYFHVRLPGLT